MNELFFKVVPSLFLIIYWLFFCLKYKKSDTVLATLLLTSFVAFSSNFTFFFRELHQVIIMLPVLYFVYRASRSGGINKNLKFFIVFFIFIVLSIINNTFDDDAKIQLVNYFVIVLLMGFISTYFFKIQNMNVFMRFIANTSFILAIFGIVESVVTSIGRIEVTFANPNYYAFYLGVGFCIMFNFRSKIKYLKLVIIASAIFLSGSRAGLIFVLLQVVWYLFLNRKYFTTIVLSVAMIFASSLYHSTRDKKAKEASDMERILLIKIVAEMVDNHPVFGIGWGRFPTEFSKYNRNIGVGILSDYSEIDLSKQDKKVTHNDFLRVLSELGISGFMFFISFIVYLFFVIVKYKLYRVNLFFIPSFLGVILFSLTHNNMNSILFWIFLFLPIFYKNKMNIIKR